MRILEARKRTIITLAVAAAAAIGLAACGSSSDTTSTANAAATSASGGSANSSGGATIAVSNSAGIGDILVDSKGRTLYLFEADSDGKSTCSGACAQAWPPVTSKGQPTAGGGVDASKLGTTTRDDGSVQVTYAGHPLYLYAGDSGPGQANGNGSDAFGAEWYALTPAGDNAEGSSEGSGSGGEDSSTSAGSGGGSGTGYSY